MASFQPFHLGRHQCIGLKFAWAEMRVVVARILYTFDLRLADEKDKYDWGEQKSFITWVKRPLNVVITGAKRSA
jgi:cytochrome P450